LDTENRRRELASQSPGLGALMALPDVPYGPGIGISDVQLPPCAVCNGIECGTPRVKVCCTGCTHSA